MEIAISKGLVKSKTVIIKERYKIEAKNSELKNSHGYGHAIAGGIHNMELQAALTMFAVNLKRIFKLMEEK